MKQRKSRLPLFLRLMAWIMVFWISLLSVTMVVTMYYARRTFENKVDDVLMSTVVTLGRNPIVAQSIREGACPPDFAEYLSDVVRNTSDMDFITIADRNSIRIYHIDPDYIGLPFEGGDQNRALKGERYLSDAGTENFEDQRRAFHPVLAEDGTVLGFVMASATHARLKQLLSPIYETYFRLFLILTLLTLTLNAPLAIYLRRNLRGVRPEDLLRVYLTQNHILNAMEDGLISYDKT